MPSFKYLIELSDEERKELNDIVSKGCSPAKTILRANILLASDRNSKKYMTVAEYIGSSSVPGTEHLLESV